MPFLLRRKEDNRYRLKAPRWDADPWTADTQKAQVFKTVGGCKHAVNGYLCEKVMLGTFSTSWDNRKFENFKWVHHPEWFDEKFEVVPVTIEVKL